MDQSTGELIKRLSRLELQQAKLQRSNKHLRVATGAVMLLCGAAAHDGGRRIRPCPKP